jgi:hypothetical protein
MSAKLLQLNFHFSTSADEYEEAVSALAENFAAVPGLRWKVWLMNESENEAGGIYLFQDESSRQQFLESDLAAMVMAHPALSEFSAKPFDVMEDLTAATRGPVGETVEV